MKFLLFVAFCLWIYSCFLSIWIYIRFLTSLKLFSHDNCLKTSEKHPPLTAGYVRLHHSPQQTIGGAVREKQTAAVSWKLSKLDHLLLGCSRMMFLLFKFTSKVPNNAKQLGRTATTQQGLE